jgi:hypothetical protein
MQADTPGMEDAAWSRLARVAKETATAKRQAAEAAAKQTAKQRASGQGALSLAATSEKEWDAVVVPESTSGTSGGTRVVQQAGGASP